ncbi:MAG: hypothetical protein Q3971_01620 [Moraxella sp.]|nr:hypothetical protein [Moraxella sp.]
MSVERFCSTDNLIDIFIMWLFILEFIPEIYSGIRKMYYKKNYYGIFLLLILFLCFWCIYYDFYRNYIISILILFFCIEIIIRVKECLKETVMDDISVQSEVCLQECSKTVTIGYAHLTKDGYHHFVIDDYDIAFFLPVQNNKSHIIINKSTIYSVKLSPIRNFGTMFMQKIIDKHHRTFLVKIRLKGVFKPYFQLDVKNLNK